jgi:hypothetical protein
LVSPHVLDATCCAGKTSLSGLTLVADRRSQRFGPSNGVLLAGYSNDSYSNDKWNNVAFLQQIWKIIGLGRDLAVSAAELFVN